MTRGGFGFRDQGCSCLPMIPALTPIRDNYSLRNVDRFHGGKEAGEEYYIPEQQRDSEGVTGRAVVEVGGCIGRIRWIRPAKREKQRRMVHTPSEPRRPSRTELVGVEERDWKTSIGGDL
ncbi:unnamed protein product [Arabis nemorensis]|uniref:Uncharacterized protein n=1 Tax=Arabis nemorensis TaxID=586526 RepID=A0A565BTS8_9BRAS|nr:unnamed protein product [Arabis nemorensis]